ncbi:CDP-glycerol glycerophosphotransferase family protein [Sporolactobacillus kofuensis]|uniref:CDP-glycerol glycerophosphotransferase family protein n=1 Tax=Sporolactobacillus kofuensis TaxID=269672 RepID=A0ABW1WBA8_9BACL|nr:CDP-glycerol glycerophosphotransferase family protein [Sporolactobacillus kofuensis]MCO7174551.1 CDP-glycerol glycerophosphotransferase family protein [Sporolactobacillus kofuensis]
MFCKIFALRNKIVFVCSYTDNIQFVYDEINQRRQFDQTEIIFLCRGKRTQTFFSGTGRSVIPFETANIMAMVRSAFHLATARLIVVDNYFGFLSVASFKKNAQCIQLWHACGAFKTFGFNDHSVAYRTQRARNRFAAVYQNFHKIVVGSDAMQEIFKQSFGLDDTHFVSLGVPRTDLFFDRLKQDDISKTLHQQSGGKKIILYAPTFRDVPIDDGRFGLELKEMENALKDNYVLILRLHPAEKGRIDFNRENNFVIDGSKWSSVNELLLATDLLITDYSSIPFEFSLLKRPMIFFPYDLKEYVRTRGLWESYKQEVPGPIVYSTDDLIKVIKKESFDQQKITNFSKRWNHYSNGYSSRNVADFFEELLLKNTDEIK